MISRRTREAKFRLNYLFTRSLRWESIMKKKKPEIDRFRSLNQKPQTYRKKFDSIPIETTKNKIKYLFFDQYGFDSKYLWLNTSYIERDERFKRR